MSAMPDLTTERLLIRPLTQADFSSIHRIFSAACGHPEAVTDPTAQQARQD